MSEAQEAAPGVEPRLPWSPYATAWRNRRLIAVLGRRHFEARYRRSLLGSSWFILQPLFLLCVYYVVFSTIFRSRWDAGAGFDGQPFALLLFSGLVIYWVFADTANEAPRLIQSNRIYLNQGIFPTETLPWVSLFGSLISFTLSSIVFAVFFLTTQGLPPPTWLLFPLLMIPLSLFALGTSLWLSSLGAFVDDVAHVVRLFTTALLFLSPIFYPLARVPEDYQGLYLLNPIARLLEMSKAVLFVGVPPDWSSLLGVTIAASIFVWSGHVWFVRVKRGFADVL